MEKYSNRRWCQSIKGAQRPHNLSTNQPTPSSRILFLLQYLKNSTRDDNKQNTILTSRVHLPKLSWFYGCLPRPPSSVRSGSVPPPNTSLSASFLTSGDSREVLGRYPLPVSYCSSIFDIDFLSGIVLQKQHGTK